MRNRLLKINLIIIMLLSVTLIACKKEHLSQNDSASHAVEDDDTCTCVNIPPIEGYSIGYTSYYEPNFISFPIFNPNDDNEILFLRTISTNVKELVRYNLETRQQNILFSGQIFSVPAWSKQGWIVFANGYNGLYKIRPDGSEKTLIIPTTKGFQFSPTFNKTGDTLLTYHAFYTEGQFPAKFWNLEGELLDSMNYEVNQQPKWNAQNKISFRGNNDEIFIVDANTKELVKKLDTFLGHPGAYSHGFVWINENEVILEQGYDVKKLNVWTGELTKVFCGCDSRKYQVFDANDNGSKVIFNKIIYEVKDTIKNILFVYSKVSIYDMENDTLYDVKIE